MGTMVCDCGAPSHCGKCPCCANPQDDVWNVHHVEVVDVGRVATVTIYLMAGGRVTYEFEPIWLDYDDIGIDVIRTDHAT